jgi:hypothetical protein
MSTTAPAAAGGSKDVEAAVQAWAAAWAAKDMSGYLGAYGKEFDPPGSMSRSAWESERRSRIVGKNKISVKVSDPERQRQRQQGGGEVQAGLQRRRVECVQPQDPGAGEGRGPLDDRQGIDGRLMKSLACGRSDRFGLCSESFSRIVRMKRASLVLLCLSCACLAMAGTAAASQNNRNARHPAKPQRPAAQRAPLPADGEAEARLIEVYKLIGHARAGRPWKRPRRWCMTTRTSSSRSSCTETCSPRGRARCAPSATCRTRRRAPGAQMLAELREKSQLRIRALREKPPAGAIPAQFLQLSPRNKHAIAIDASRARLYLFENTPAGLKLLSDYYISVASPASRSRPRRTCARRWACTSSPATSTRSR